VTVTSQHGGEADVKAIVVMCSRLNDVSNNIIDELRAAAASAAVAVVASLSLASLVVAIACRSAGIKPPCVSVSPPRWQDSGILSPRAHTLQWRRQRSKGARSFRGQKILEPGHPESGA